MKSLSKIVGIVLVLISQNINAQDLDSIIDQRDGKIYKITRIGDQVWMAQNLNYDTINSWNYGNVAENGEKFGRLYNWNEAKNACPFGWHLPSDSEWQQLETYLGMSDAELNKSNAWRGSNQGERLIADSTFSFNILFAGYRNPPSNYNLLNLQAFFWTATDEYGSAWFRQFYEGSTKIFRRSRPVSWAFSVRCIKD